MGYDLVSHTNTHGTFHIGSNASSTAILLAYRYDSVYNCTSVNDWTNRHPQFTYPSITGTIPSCPTVGQTYTYYAHRLVTGYPGISESLSWTIVGGTIVGNASATVIAYTYDTVKVQWNASGPHMLICSRTGTGTTIAGSVTCINRDTVSDGGATPPTIVGPSGVCGSNTTATYSASTFPSGFTYNWTCSNGSIVSGQGTQTVTVNWAGAGTLTLTRTAVPCGWTSTATKSVAYAAGPGPTVNLGPNMTYCFGSTVAMNAGPGFTSYQWSNAYATQVSHATTSGNYSVTVTNAAGCVASDTVTITMGGTATAPSWPNAQTVCGSGTITPGTYTSYLWNTGATTPSITPAASGIYAVTVSDGTCSSTTHTNVTISTPPTPNLGPNTSFCQGSGFFLNAGPGASWAWNTGETTQIIQPAASGTYSVTVTNAQGCTGSSSVTLTMLPSPMPTITYVPMPVCAGATATLSSSPFPAYQWSTGATTPSITVSPPGSWGLTVTAANGCTGSTSVFVSTLPAPTPSLPANMVGCTGTPVTLNPGTFAAYSWSTGATTQTISTSTAGTYTVTVTDGNGCTASASCVVTFNAPPTPNLGPNQTVCAGSPIILNPGNYVSYIWSSGATSNMLIPTTSGTYTVTVSDANGCIGTASTTITILPAPTPNLGPDLNVCAGANVILNPGSFASYLWSNAATTPTISTSIPGTYDVTVTGANGCTASDTILITVLPLPTFSLGADTFMCADTFVTMNGPAGMSNYAWSSGPTTASISVTTGGTYALTVTDGNGCTASDDKVVTALTDCVFPGDANYDGVANNLDVLTIGAYAGTTGAFRPGWITQWYGQALADWGGALPGVADPKHSDCNGGGLVNIWDTLVVAQNYGLTHSKNAGVTGGPVTLRVRCTEDSIHPGNPVWFVIELGDSQNVATDIYGLAFRLTPAGMPLLAPGIAWLDYTNCWFAPSNHRISFTMPFGGNSPVDVAVVRDDQVPQSGFGEVLTFLVATDVNMPSVREPMMMTLTDVLVVDANLNPVPVTVVSDTVIISNLVIGRPDGGVAAPTVFPNPTQGSVRIQQQGGLVIATYVMDALGQQLKAVRNGAGDAMILETDDLAAGMYFLRIETSLGSYVRRLVVE